MDEDICEHWHGTRILHSTFASSSCLKSIIFDSRMCWQWRHMRDATEDVEICGGLATYRGLLDGTLTALTWKHCQVLCLAAWQVDCKCLEGFYASTTNAEESDIQSFRKALVRISLANAGVFFLSLWDDLELCPLEREWGYSITSKTNCCCFACDRQATLDAQAACASIIACLRAESCGQLLLVDVNIHSGPACFVRKVTSRPTRAECQSYTAAFLIKCWQKHSRAYTGTNK